jgi:hypothetical protein
MLHTSPVRRAGTDRVIVVPCSGRKKTEPAPAGELYLGSYHRACRATADVLTAAGGTVLVLSARHGLVPLDQVLEPYDVTMDDPDAVAVPVLEAQARQLGVDQARDVTILAGAAYADKLASIWSHASRPLAGLGIGQQRQRLAELRDRAERQAAPQPVEIEFHDAPMYRPPYDYRQSADPRPFTVTVVGAGRHGGEFPMSYVVEAYSTQEAWAKALAWVMLDQEAPDAYVVAAESFEGVPAAGSGMWTDLRPEHARQARLDDLADQAAEAVDRFDAQTRALVDARGHVLPGSRSDYEKAVGDAAFTAWPLLVELAASDGRN